MDEEITERELWLAKAICQLLGQEKTKDEIEYAFYWAARLAKNAIDSPPAD